MVFIFFSFLQFSFNFLSPLPLPLRFSLAIINQSKHPLGCSAKTLGLEYFSLDFGFIIFRLLNLLYEVLTLGSYSGDTLSWKHYLRVLSWYLILTIIFLVTPIKC